MGAYRTLVDRYELREWLAEGGMAIVWQGWDTKLCRRVAIKLLPQPLLDSPHFVERFQGEARRVATLLHPNIVRLYDWHDVDEGQPFLVMELIEGGDLRHRLGETGGRLPVPEAVTTACRVLDALAYAHARGTVHRDIKPENILLDGHGPHPEVKVSDFGIAREVDDARTLTGAGVIGTPWYMPPEQRGGEARVTADLYSVGCVLLECLAGESVRGPWPAYRAPELATLTRRREVPGSLASLLRRALAEQPEDRFQSAEEMRATLESCRVGHGTLPKPPAAEKALKAKAAKVRAERASVSGRWGDALRHYEDALAIYRELGKQQAAGATLDAMGMIAHCAGGYEAALGFYERALAIHRELRNRPNEAVTLDALGDLARQQGRWGEAVDNFVQAKAIHRELGNRWNAMKAESNMIACARANAARREEPAMTPSGLRLLKSEVDGHVQDRPSRTARRRETRRRGTRCRTHHRVLVVDDNEDSRLLTCMQLELDSHFKVVGEAANGVEAIRLARELKPDAVLLDLLMPSMDGCEALPLIRHAAPEAIVIMLSVLPPGRNADRARSSGAAAYLVRSHDNGVAAALRGLCCA